MRNIVIIFLIFTALFAQPNQEFMLKDVSVEGNVVSTANTIIFTSGLRKGAKISSAEFPRAIKRLWQLGLFDDVQIKYDEETDNEVSITIVVLESNIIGNVKYNGNKKIKDSKFKEELDLIFDVEAEKKWDKAIKITGIDFSKFSSYSGKA